MLTAIKGMTLQTFDLCKQLDRQRLWGTQPIRRCLAEGIATRLSVAQRLRGKMIITADLCQQVSGMQVDYLQILHRTKLIVVRQ